jgi:hypothetical protein
MVELVVGVNIAIALLGFYLAWRIWQAKQTLRAASLALTAWERSIRDALASDQTPALVLEGQQATASMRRHYAHWQTQLRQLQKILGISLIVLRLLQQKGWLRQLVSRKR